MDVDVFGVCLGDKILVGNKESKTLRYNLFDLSSGNSNHLIVDIYKDPFFYKESVG